MKFKASVATGATEEEIDPWIRQNATQKDPTAIIKWNNEMRFFFDVYDVEEGLL